MSCAILYHFTRRVSPSPRVFFEMPPPCFNRRDFERGARAIGMFARLYLAGFIHKSLICVVKGCWSVACLPRAKWYPAVHCVEYGRREFQ
jgi:hypothetical protein